VHRRVAGRLEELPNPASLAVPPRGDGALYSTAGDYAQFLRLILRDGEVGGKRLLSERATSGMTTNQIGTLRVRRQPAADVSRAVTFPEGADHDAWTFGFQMTAVEGAVAGRRSAGSLGWGGLNNTHFFIDPRRGVAAVVLMQLLPFHDAAAMRAYHGFERALYQALPR
jgi:CubicO group peptidase (beta-lactamase class C family)